METCEVLLWRRYKQSVKKYFKSPCLSNWKVRSMRLKPSGIPIPGSSLKNHFFGRAFLRERHPRVVKIPVPTTLEKKLPWERIEIKRPIFMRFKKPFQVPCVQVQRISDYLGTSLRNLFHDGIFFHRIYVKFFYLY